MALACLLATPAPLAAQDDPPTAKAAAKKINPALTGYADYDTLCEQIAKLSESDAVRATSLGKTLGDREIHLLTIGSGETDSKPALLVVGNVHAPHLVGSELALRIARRLADGVDADEKIKALLDRFTVYIIPRPNPDGSERCLHGKPWIARQGNNRKTDDDRDGEIGEDPPDDLNGDGRITMMRVRDDTGRYMPHPKEPRVMIEADPQKNERGMYRLLVEGRNDDDDEQFNEDGSGGVSFNRNFTFRYPYFKKAAGPHQVSEIESRAVADFAFDHLNIALVVTFVPEGNLMHPWKPNAAAEKERAKKKVLGADAPYFKFLADGYRKAHGGKDAPAPAEDAGEGAFAEWAYFHFGRWSLATRAWWVPKVPAEETADEKAADEDTDAEETPAEDAPDKKTPEKTTPDEKQDPKQDEDADDKEQKTESKEERGADDVNALRWFELKKIDGFVDWSPIAGHPDFPDKQVEVGGFQPMVRLNPPVDQLDELGRRHTTFLVGLGRMMPSVKIHDVTVEPLGGGTFRITAVVVNSGYLPTMSEMGRISQQLQPLQIEIELPKQAGLIRGHRRAQLDRILGSGGKVEHEWIVRLEGDKPATVPIKLWMPSVGTDRTQIKLDPAAPPSPAPAKPDPVKTAPAKTDNADEKKD